jgi:hypothetical protein
VPAIGSGSFTYDLSSACSPCGEENHPIDEHFLPLHVAFGAAGATPRVTGCMTARRLLRMRKEREARSKMVIHAAQIALAVARRATTGVTLPDVLSQVRRLGSPGEKLCR